MRSSKVQSVGRIHYIDPNDFYNKIPNGIPHPYEDYAISVDLTVEFGTRSRCGAIDNDDNGGGGTLAFSSDRGSINFIGGTNGFLTTNFTDIESTNPMRNTNECLGIESINIKYSSWYVPQVNIKFIDVRGASLLAPQEEGYVTTLQKELASGKGASKSIEQGSFFKALFSFPYPRFKLKVKGFYGKEVTYNLSVHKFNAQFNSDTGNFEVDVDFIGYMYGVYTDVPMNLLLIAPYCSTHGTPYWEKNNAFTYMNSDQRIMTYPELLMKMANMNPTVEDDSGSTDQGEKENKNERELAELRKIEEAVNEFYNSAFVNYRIVKDTLRDQYFLFGVSEYKEITIENKASDETFSAKARVLLKKIFTSEDGSKAIDLTGQYALIASLISQYNTDFTNTIDPQVNGMGVTGKNIIAFVGGTTSGTRADGTKVELQYSVETYSHNTDMNVNNVWSGLSANLESGRQYYLHLPVIVGPPSTFVTKDIAMLSEHISDMEKAQEKSEEERNEKKKERISIELGFPTSIGNMFRMSFAHMDTFVQIFNSYYQKIKDLRGKGKRTLNALKWSVQNTDLPTTFDSTNDVPPFTMFYKEQGSGSNGLSNTDETAGKKKLPVWPGNMDIDKTALPEIEFVEELVAAAEMYNEEVSNAFEESESDVRSEGGNEKNYILTTRYDMAYGYGGRAVNPYAYLRDISDPQTAGWAALLTFILRLNAWAKLSPTPTRDEVSSFGKLEARNLALAYPTVLSTLKYFLNETANQKNFGTKAVDYFRGVDSSVKKCYDLGYDHYRKHVLTYVNDNKALKYDWLYNKKESGDIDEYLPVGTGNPLEVSKFWIPNQEYINLTTPSENPVWYELIESPTTSEDGNSLSKYDRSRGLVASLNIDNSIKKNYIDIVDFPEITTATTLYCGETMDKAVELPKKFKKNLHIDCPSYICRCGAGGKKDYLPTFGDPLFYAQNAFADEEQRRMAKAVLFAMGLPISSQSDGTKPIPRALMIRRGAIYYEALTRRETGKDVFYLPSSFKKATGNQIYFYGEKGVNLIKSDSDQKYNEEETIDERNRLMAEYFENWAKSNEFNTYLKAFELKSTPLTAPNDGELITNASYWNNFINYSEFFNGKKYKFKDLFLASGVKQTFTVDGKTVTAAGSTSPDFYDPDQEIKINGSDYILKSKKSDKNGEDIGGTFVKNMYGTYAVLINTGYHRGTATMYTADVIAAIDAFISELKDKKVYGEQLSGSAEESVTSSGNINTGLEDKYDDLKLATYMTLKNLHDKWFCMNKNINRWKLFAPGDTSEKTKESEFSQFKFIDSFYRKIENSLLVNVQSVTETASQMMASSNNANSVASSKYEGHSFYEFLSEVCRKNEAQFMSLPMENEFTNPEGIQDLFDTFPYSKMDNRDTACHVCLYTNKPSEHLDLNWNTPEYMYASDGFNIANARGEVLNETNLLPQLTSVNEGYPIPAFGVSFGKQNQSFFTKIDVGMQNPQATEASIAATMSIASKGGEGPNQTALFGQDLYRIYSNYSYTCNVEMMGDAQITPLTYFQLNNIPMFRGVYMVISVEHSISAGKMMTKFTGVRMSKYDTPFVKDSVLVIHSRAGSPSTSNRREGPPIGDADFDDWYETRKLTTTLPKFKVGQFLASTTSDIYNKNHPNDPVPREPNSTQRSDLEGLVKLMDELNAAWNSYCKEHSSESWAAFDHFQISSGFRSDETNNAQDSMNGLVGGAKGGGHPNGVACDFVIPNSAGAVNNDMVETVYRFLIKYMRRSGIVWDQIIFETSGSRVWIHLGYKRPPNAGPDRKQTISYKNGNYYPYEI